MIWSPKLLRTLIRRSRLSLTTISLKTGCHVNSLRRWANGERIPDAKFVGALAWVLQCQPDDFFLPENDPDR